MKEWIKKKVGEVSVKALITSLSFVAALLIFGFVADEVVLENEDLFDSKAFHFFRDNTGPGFVKAMKLITFFGSSYFLFPAYVVLVSLLFLKHQWQNAIDVLIIACSSTALMFGLKKFFHRHRPELPLFKALTNYSFPSGHALS